MRITFVLPNVSLSGGIKIVLEYAEFLRLQGHDVICFCPAPRRRSWNERLRALLRGGGPIEVDPASSHLWGKGVSIYRSRHPGAASMEDMPDADIVVATWWETAEWIASLPPAKGVKCHFIQDHEIFPGQPVERVRAIYGSNLSKITVSAWLKEILKSEYGSDDVVLIPNGIQTDRFRADQRTAERRLNVGHLWTCTPRKNSMMALRAMEIARRDLPELRGLFFGGDPYPVELRDIDWIEYVRTPPQNEIPALYAQCRCWLFSSITEGFGLPLLEALASGTPVIATRAGAAPDLIDGTNGRLIDCTAEAMAAAIIEIARMPEPDWQAMSNRAGLVALGHDWLKSARKFEEALQGIAARIN